MRSILSILLNAALVLSLGVDPIPTRAASVTPVTPIQHIVIIFGENISFDHYFGTYPKAVNPPGEPAFHGSLGGNTVNNLLTPTGVCYVNGSVAPCPNLLTDNPNYTNTSGNGTTNGITNASNPFRLDRSQALTADMSHSYTPEEKSFDNGNMDLFPSSTGSAGAPPNYYPQAVYTKGLVMGYFDGNTVTAFWNYAQRFAMNDNSYNSNFGPSTPGAINLISGQTNGAVLGAPGTSSAVVSDGNGGLTDIGDSDPTGDACSTSAIPLSFSGQNIGDLLNAKGLSWGWFQGGFDLTITNPNGTVLCHRSTVSPTTGLAETDYVPHHEPFQYYASTRNLAHTRPASVAIIGAPADGPSGANHQYDTHDFFDALAANNLPAVSFLKAPSYQDAHPGNSNPLDEQAFVVKVVNALQNSPFWNSTAVVINYDDSDGWYDHQFSPKVNGSNISNVDVMSQCQTTPTQLTGVSGTYKAEGRCGYGVRTPMIVISPWALQNYIDHTVTDQTSIIRFIEDNWLGRQRIGNGSYDTIANSIAGMFNFTGGATPPNAAPLILNPTSGEPQ